MSVIVLVAAVPLNGPPPPVPRKPIESGFASAFVSWIAARSVQVALPAAVSQTVSPEQRRSRRRSS